MSVSSVITALQVKHASLTGITTASTTVHASLNTADLPRIITLPGAATWNHAAMAFPRSERIYIVRCYVSPIAQGEGIDEGYQDTVTMIQTMGDAYKVWQDWHGANFEQIATVTDGGHVVLEYAGIMYHGVEFQLTLVEKPT